MNMFHIIILPPPPPLCLNEAYLKSHIGMGVIIMLIILTMYCLRRALYTKFQIYKPKPITQICW